MIFLDLNDDVKLIISKHLLIDFKFSAQFSSKHQYLQKILFGEVVFDDDLRKILKIQNDNEEMIISKMQKYI